MKLDTTDILVSLIDPDSTQPRKNFSIEDLRELGESMKTLGQWVPIIVRKNGERYTLVDGERRKRAAELASMLMLSAITVDDSVTAADIKAIKLLHKKDLTPYELFLGCMEWFKENPSGTAKELAGKIGRDPSIVSKICSLKDTLPAVQEAAAAGRLGITPWNELSKNPADVQHAMLAAYLTNGVTRESLKKTRQARNGLAETKVKRVIIPCSGSTVTVSGEGLDIVALVDIIEKLLKELRKSIGKVDLSAFIAAQKSKAKAVQP